MTPEEEFRLIRVPGEEAEALPENEQQMLLYLQSAASQKERDQFFRGGDVVGKRRTAMSLLEKGYLELSLIHISSRRLWPVKSSSGQDRYFPASTAATAPSDAAVTSWRRGLVRTSPAANTPGRLVRQSSPAQI